MQLSLASATNPPDQMTTPPTTDPPPTSVELSASPTTQDQLGDALRSNQQLRREIQLLASAWYDQNQRHMYDNASTPRGKVALEPRSFLGKQRRVVEDVMIGKPSS